MWRDDLQQYLADNMNVVVYWDKALYDEVPLIVLKWNTIEEYNNQAVGTLTIYLYDSNTKTFEDLKDMKYQVMELVEDFVANSNEMHGIVWSEAESLLTLTEQNLIAWKFGGTTLVHY